MDIKVYVRDHIKLDASVTADNQFAVLAFDLGLVGPKWHPPPAAPQFSENIRANGESGPWSVQPHNYSPVSTPVLDGATGKVLIKKDRFGDDTVTAAGKEHYGQRETIHAERSLIARLHLYLALYQRKHGQLPGSISLYSNLSPCRHCIEILQPLPKKTGIPLWTFAYSHPYVSKDAHESRGKTDYYPDAKTAINAAETLRLGGWHVI